MRTVFYPCQSVTFVERQAEGKLIPGDVMNQIIAYVSAILEVKSSMGLSWRPLQRGPAEQCLGRCWR